MRGNCKAGKGRFIVHLLLRIAAGGILVTLLWNWLMPSLFALKEISLLQGFGILLLSKILFSGFHGCGLKHRHAHLACCREQVTTEEHESRK